MEIKHNFISAEIDGGDTTQVQPSHWNDAHSLSVTGPALVGKPTGGAGAATEIPLDSSLQFDSGSLKVNPSISGTTLSISSNAAIGSTATASETFAVSAIAYNPGTIAVSGTSVTGTGTAFTKTFKQGDTLTSTTTAGSETREVQTLTSDTAMTVTTAFAGTSTAAAYTSSNTGTQFVVLPNGNVRIGGSSVNSNSLVSDVLLINPTRSITGTQQFSTFRDVTVFNQSVGATGNINSIICLTQLNATGTGTFGPVRGFNSAPTVLSTNTGNISTIASFLASPQIQAGATGTITNWSGFVFNGTNASTTNTISTIYGINISPAQAGGTLTNFAGAAIVKPVAATNSALVLLGTTGVPTGNYSIYSSTTADNYLAGRLGVGVTAPAGALDVGAIVSNPGTVTVSSTTVAGTSTLFTSTFKPSDRITVTTTSGSETKEIQSITNDTAMVMVSGFSGTATAVAYTSSNTGSQFVILPSGSIRAMGTTGLSASNVSDWIYKGDSVNVTGTQIFSAIRDRTIYNQTVSASGTINGVAAGPNINATSTGTFTDTRGVNAFPTVLSTNTGNSGTITGVHASPQVQAGAIGTITNFNGLLVNSNNASTTNTITNMYGVQVAPTQAGGTLTNYAGLAVNAKPTAATNSSLLLLGTTTIPAGNYGIYNSSTNDNYLAGKLGVGIVPASGYHVDVFSTDAKLRIRDSGQTSGLEISQQNSDGGNKIFAINNNYLSFGTNNTERMRINAAGATSIIRTNTQEIQFDGGSNKRWRAISGVNGATDGDFTLQYTTDGFSSNFTNAAIFGSTGSIGIGASPSAATVVLVNKNHTGAVTTQSFRTASTIQTDVTSEARGYISLLGTQASSFTLGNIQHFYAGQGTFGAGSSVTNQYGFAAVSSLVGATNNYGFYADIPSGTGRWNFYAPGTASNFMAGSLGIGAVPVAGQSLFLNKTITGNVNSTAVRNQGVVQSDVTTTVYAFDNVAQTVASSFTLPQYIHYNSQQGTFGAGSSVSTQIGFNAGATLTGATSNYGFHGNIASGTGRYNLYMNGTADNYMAGSLGIGIVPAVTTNLYINKAITGGTIAYGILNTGAVQSGTVTSAASYFHTNASSSAGNTTTVLHYATQQGTFTGTVTNQLGFHANSSLTGATNNYGFYGEIAAGTGRYNFYAAGTAANYFAGDLQLNKTVTSGGTTGAQTINKTIGSVNFAASASSLVVTNSLVTTSSIIIATVATNDSTMKSVAVVAGAGSFTLHANAAATAETRVNFMVMN